MVTYFLYQNVKNILEFLEVDTEIKEERMYDLKEFGLVLQTIGIKYLKLTRRMFITLEK
jgi:hypothetical protein